MTATDAGRAQRTAAPPSSSARELLRLSRPEQWAKNLLVLSAPAAAGLLLEPRPAVQATLLTMAFVLASAAVYAVNDVHDRELDARHPYKRERPVAAGRIGVRTALAAAAAWALAGASIAFAVRPAAGVLLLAYLAVSALYTARLREVAVLDVVCVASGFVIRALAGAAAVEAPASSWFLLVALFGALFLVVAKRKAESRGSDPSWSTRATLGSYSADWLSQVLTLSLTGTLLAYCAWAFQVQGEDAVRPVLAVSVVPVLVALLRYLLLVDGGRGERPEIALAHDRTLLLAALSWLVLMLCGLYLA